MTAPTSKSKFSGLTGVITGIAGILTATVALLGLAANQGWLSSGGGSSKSSTGSGGATTLTTMTTVGPNGTTGPGSTALGSPSTSVDTLLPQYSVQPATLGFQPADPATKSVSVSNTGLVPMTVEPPMVTGADPSRFAAMAEPACSSSLEPGRSCTIQVTFKHAPGNFSAKLVIQVTGAPRATEVDLKGSAIL